MAVEQKNQKTLIGRVQEQVVLKHCLDSKKSELLAVYGRRRVGKTFLIKNFFEQQAVVFFYAPGIKDATLALQLEEFSKQISKTFYDDLDIKVPKNWMGMFESLTKAMGKVPESKKIVLFFDELPWMATARSGLLQALDYYWNRYWSHNRRVKLIVCGSAASWILENIINNKGGLYNRVTRQMKLDPFTLYETKAFLLALGIKLSDKQVLDLYMVFGGIPHYLALIEKGQSAAQCIDALCFQKNGALVREFDRLFESLFKDSQAYLILVRTIAKHRYGIGQAALIKEAGVPNSGRTKQRLRELEEAGFIMEFIPHGHQEKGLYYRIIDEFTFFFLRWVKPNMKTIVKQDRSGGYWLSKTQLPQWKAWAGLTFEAICHKHVPQIRKALHISVGAAMGAWKYLPRGKEEQGTQIDLLFDRDDGVITICEIKYNEQPFVIDKEQFKKLENKLCIYKQQTRTKKDLFLAMITVNGLKPSVYSEEIHGVVRLEDLFLDV